MAEAEVGALESITVRWGGPRWLIQGWSRPGDVS